MFTTGNCVHLPRSGNRRLLVALATEFGRHSTARSPARDARYRADWGNQVGHSADSSQQMALVGPKTIRAAAP